MGSEYIIVQNDQDIQILTNLEQGIPGPPGLNGATFLTAKITQSGNLIAGFSYDLDLANASAPVLLTLPDATLIAGQGIRIKVISYSSVNYWKLLTINGQTVDQYASGQFSTQGLPQDQVLYMLLGVQANSLGNYNIVEGGL